MAATYADRADFLTVYIKEAHPTDEWQVTSNETDSVCYMQPKTLDDRRAIANDFVTRYGWPMSLVVDTMANDAEKAYAAWPERLYVIGANGTVTYKGAMGPQGFFPDEVDAHLRAALTPVP